MVLCPIALAVGCKKCPAFKVCPVKGAIGDYKPEAPAPAKSASADKGRSPPKPGKPKPKRKK